MNPEYRYAFKVTVPRSFLTVPSVKYWNPYVLPVAKQDHDETLIREFVIAGCAP